MWTTLGFETSFGYSIWRVIRWKWWDMVLAICNSIWDLTDFYLFFDAYRTAIRCLQLSKDYPHASCCNLSSVAPGADPGEGGLLGLQPALWKMGKYVLLKIWMLWIRIIFLILIFCCLTAPKMLKIALEIKHFRSRACSRIPCRCQLHL